MGDVTLAHQRVIADSDDSDDRIPKDAELQTRYGSAYLLETMLASSSMPTFPRQWLSSVDWTLTSDPANETLKWLPEYAVAGPSLFYDGSAHTKYFTHRPFNEVLLTLPKTHYDVTKVPRTIHDRTETSWRITGKRSITSAVPFNLEPITLAFRDKNWWLDLPPATPSTPLGDVRYIVRAIGMVVHGEGFLSQPLDKYLSLQGSSSQDQAPPLHIKLRYNPDFNYTTLSNLLLDYSGATILQLTAQDLKRQGFVISSGRSWNRTLQDVVLAINDLLNDSTHEKPFCFAKYCSYIIVSFAPDAAITVSLDTQNGKDSASIREASLVTAASEIEHNTHDVSPGETRGYESSIAACVLHYITKTGIDGKRATVTLDTLNSAVKAGIAAAKYLHIRGMTDVQQSPYRSFERNVILPESDKPSMAASYSHYFLPKPRLARPLGPQSKQVPSLGYPVDVVGHYARLGFKNGLQHPRKLDLKDQYLNDLAWADGKIQCRAQARLCELMEAFKQINHILREKLVALDEIATDALPDDAKQQLTELRNSSTRLQRSLKADLALVQRKNPLHNLSIHFEEQMKLLHDGLNLADDIVIKFSQLEVEQAKAVLDFLDQMAKDISLEFSRIFEPFHYFFDDERLTLFRWLQDADRGEVESCALEKTARLIAFESVHAVLSLLISERSRSSNVTTNLSWLRSVLHCYQPSLQVAMAQFLAVLFCGRLNETSNIDSESNARNVILKNLRVLLKRVEADWQDSFKGLVQISVPPVTIQQLLEVESPRAIGPTIFGESWRQAASAKAQKIGRGTLGPQDIARNVIERGEAALQELGLLYAKFGPYITCDSLEIEASRELANRFKRYAFRISKRQPLNIGVYGPPGSGKSFSVKAICNSVFPDGMFQYLKFNLSQLSSKADLHDAFHSIRDVGIRGKLPVVFWDEYDSSFNGVPFGWLPLFLEPMQDGVFQEGQLERPIGRSIFCFAGGRVEKAADLKYVLSNEFTGSEIRAGYWVDHSTRIKTEQASGLRDALLNNKGRDFLSRLLYTYDVPSLNPQVSAGRIDFSFDVCIRRALLIRAFLKEYVPGFRHDSTIAVSQDVCDYLLTGSLFWHGSRSLEAILRMSENSVDTEYGGTDLPSDREMIWHLDIVNGEPKVSRPS